MALSMPLCTFVGAAYFVQGVKMSLGTLTEQYYLKDDLHFSPAQACAAHMFCYPRMISGCLTQHLPLWQAKGVH